MSQSLKARLTTKNIKYLGILLGIQNMHIYTGFAHSVHFVHGVLSILPFCFNLGISSI